ncbi:MAG: SAM-dependent methyltransferase, partial [Candidatus Caldatribacteriaceae bacterium]
LEKGIDFEVLPGPSSLLLGVVYSGFSDPGFIFLGFLPRKGGERKRILERSLSSPFSVILCESPHRVVETLQDIQEIVGKTREVVLLRELTKIHQEVRRGKIHELLLEYSLQTPKGEIILVVEGNKEENVTLSRKLIAMLEEKGFTKKEIVEILNEGFALRKRTIRRSLEKR